MRDSKSPPSRRDSNKTASGKPGAVQSFTLVGRGGLFLIFGGGRVVHHVSLRLPNSNL
jgi:hypothetical protein